jgi:2-alkyl-3-oxoalkanoate reductase
MKALVTGATGFIGGRIAQSLRERGDEVRGLVRDPGKAGALRSQGVELAQGDMEDLPSLTRAVEGVDRVYHTAAVVGDWPDVAHTKRVNVDGTRALLEASVAAGVTRFIHISSLAVYGNKHHHGTDESAPYKYGDTYTDAKIESELVVRAFQDAGKIETVRLRPGFVYGPGDRLLIPKISEALREGKFMFVGDGSKQMNCIYIDDLGDISLLAGDAPQANGQAYNVTDGTQTKLRDFITFIANALNLPVPTRKVPPVIAVAGCYGSEYLARALGVKKAPLMNISRLRFLYYNQYYSIDKAKRELAWTPKFTYREGLPPTLAWATGKTQTNELLSGAKDPAITDVR